jgi:hypothetical protein
LQEELRAAGDDAARCRVQAKMLALDMALESLRGEPTVLPREYCRRIAERLSGRAQADPSRPSAPEPAACAPTASAPAASALASASERS